MKKRIVDVMIIIIGSFIFALSVNLFAIPNELGEGGVTGITIILYYLFEWSPGIVSLVLNGILLLTGYKYLDKSTTFYTIIAVVFISLFLILTETWKITSNETLVNAIFGGIIIGIGVGLILRVGGTTAGSTIIAKIANNYLGWSISYTILIIDIIVVLSSYFIIGIEKLMLTIIMLYVAAKVMEYIIEGVNPKKAVTIISDQPNAIAEEVIIQIDRGVTVLSGHGYYTKTSKEILYIVISKREVIKLKNIVKSIDKHAFVSIHDVRDVFGKGFLDISKA